jgi:S-(hydroxymethyl)glutathione dehydrogenase / alcohol dehydrogenase
VATAASIDIVAPVAAGPAAECGDMKAAVCRETNAPVGIATVTLDPPGPGEVQVHMVASGVCHTDLSVVTGRMPTRMPIVLGHEGAGIVEEVGEGVTGLAPGDRVVLSWVTPCGSCFYCGIGKPNLCEVGDRINVRHRMPDGSTRVHEDGTDLQVFSALGTMAERAVVPARAAVKLLADVPLDKAALLGCAVTTGVGAVLNTAQVPPGARVALFGAGGVGLNVVQGAVIAGAEVIVAVDVQPLKLELARSFGATHCVDASQVDPVAAVKELTGGRGADFTFEAIGRKESIEQAYAAARRGGTCVVIGLGARSESVSLNTLLLPIQEKRLLGSWYGGADVHRDFPRLLALYQAGRLKLDELVTKTYVLSEVNAAFADMVAGRNARGLILFG